MLLPFHSLLSLSFLALIHPALTNPVPEPNPIPIPVPVPDGGPPDPKSCNPTCEFLCTKYTLHTISIDGTSNSAVSASHTLTVTFDNQAVCPKERVECHDCGKGFRFKNCKKPWTFFVPDGPVEGPWKYDLQGLPPNRYLPDGWQPSGVITMDDIQCDAYQCGGGNNPMTCRNCVVHHKRQFYTAEKTCNLPW